MHVKSRIRTGDKVVVRTGRSKGTVGEVLRVMPQKSQALVRGVNMVVRHRKQTQTETGGKVPTEGPIHLSNLALRNPGDGKPSRVGYRLDENGRKIRYAKRSGEPIDD